MSKPKRPQSTVLGTGFIALDVVLASSEPDRRTTWAGGTCGNVLSILSYLGWSAYPLSRMNGDGAASRVQRDLVRCGVRLDFVALTPSTSTPVVFHHIQRRPGGRVSHRFSVNCPDCGMRMPSYRPVRRDTAENVSDRLPHSQVFFLDRVSRAALILARQAADAGAMVVFEPSGLGDDGLFREALALAHVVKYSRDRLGWLSEDSNLSRSALLEIETLGADGLRYRAWGVAGARRGWQTLPSYKPWSLIDGAGAGDWCTAALLHTLAHGGAEALAATTQEGIEEALRVGQGAGAWACGFEGARGGMYQHDRAGFLKQLSALRAGDDPPGDPAPRLLEPVEESPADWCQACSATP